MSAEAESETKRETVSLLSAEELDAIRQREREATPEPWRHHDPGREDGETWVALSNGDDSSMLQYQDVEFIAHARADIPALLALVESQSQRIAQLTAALQDCDRAFADWQIGVVPGRPEDILALIVKVRSALPPSSGPQQEPK